MQEGTNIYKCRFKDSSLARHKGIKNRDYFADHFCPLPRPLDLRFFLFDYKKRNLAGTSLSTIPKGVGTRVIVQGLKHLLFMGSIRLDSGTIYSPPALPGVTAEQSQEKPSRENGNERPEVEREMKCGVSVHFYMM